MINFERHSSFLSATISSEDCTELTKITCWPINEDTKAHDLHYGWARSCFLDDGRFLSSSSGRQPRIWETKLDVPDHSPLFSTDICYCSFFQNIFWEQYIFPAFSLLSCFLFSSPIPLTTLHCMTTTHSPFCHRVFQHHNISSCILEVKAISQSCCLLRQHLCYCIEIINAIFTCYPYPSLVRSVICCKKDFHNRSTQAKITWEHSFSSLCVKCGWLVNTTDKTNKITESQQTR